MLIQKRVTDAHRAKLIKMVRRAMVQAGGAKMGSSNYYKVDLEALDTHSLLEILRCLQDVEKQKQALRKQIFPTA